MWWLDVSMICIESSDCFWLANSSHHIVGSSLDCTNNGQIAWNIYRYLLFSAIRGNGGGTWVAWLARKRPQTRENDAGLFLLRLSHLPFRLVVQYVAYAQRQWVVPCDPSMHKSWVAMSVLFVRRLSIIEPGGVTCVHHEKLLLRNWDRNWCILRSTSCRLLWSTILPLVWGRRWLVVLSIHSVMRLSLSQLLFRNRKAPSCHHFQM